MPEFILTPEALLHPLSAAILGELLTLWLERYLKDWRWTPLLTLFLCLLVQVATAAVTSPALTGHLIWRACWYSFLGASVAVFGREIVLNIVGMSDRGPRNSSHLSLGARWNPPPNIYRRR